MLLLHAALDYSFAAGSEVVISFVRRGPAHQEEQREHQEEQRTHGGLCRQVD